MRGRIIGLLGEARAGKDTVGGMLVEQGYVRVAFADQVRSMVHALDPIVQRGTRVSDLVSERGWDEAKQHPEVRRLLQRMGTEAARETLGADVWVWAVIPLVERALEAGAPGVVVTDVRFANELAWIRRSPRGEVWLIRRPGAGIEGDHASELLAREITDAEVDFVLRNDGTLEQLRAQVDQRLVEE